MKIRLHLVRFMYINLLLSCCFWLYDNAVAADATTTTIKNANGEADSPADPRTHLPVSSLASGEGAVNEEKVARSLRTNFIKLTTRQNADNIVMKKLGNEPRTTSAKITKPPAAIDTSVNLNALPPSVNNNNINNDNEFISLVHHSEFDNNNNADNDEATAQVPKNQLENEVNSNVNNINQNTNANPDANEQLQQPKHVGHSTTTSPNQEQQHQHNEEESLPKIIPELPAVMVTAELPVEAEHIKDRLEAIIMPNAPSQDSSNQSENQEPSQAIEGAEKVAQKAELKINDPGGGLELGSELNAEVDINVTGDTRSLESNATVEEVPMPVFSEWAQKQMEAEASREQAMELEQQVVNSSAQRRNATGSGSGKPSPLKSRAKNYASPDCGAKIIASNGDATNTGAVLSHSSDEYMLSTCGSRIWFVVELCEAVQAQKVDLANFELFSSSPKNFTVAVSKRFPTRDWSNVGRFTAEDKRTVQTFELHPHLFGKFVRVDIHSHYSKEHFCPISLFRVFGTSEFEAFETEIRHSDELDDFDDDFAGQEQPHKTLQGNGNIFQSASDAVMQMVKKAAQVLVKPTKLLRSPESLHCYTPTAGLYSCQGCNSSIVERINNLLSCQPEQLQLLLLLPQLRAHLQHTRICQAEYNISFGSARMEQREACSGMDKRQSFYLSMLPSEHVGAMCKLLQAEYNTITVGQPVVLPQASGQQKQHFNVPEQLNENVTTADPTKESIPNGSLPAATPSLQIVPAEISSADNPPNTEIRQDPLATIGEPPSDVNIFNVPKDNQKDASTTSGTTASNVPEAPKPIPTPPLADKEVEVASTQDNTMPISQQAPTAATTLESESGDLIGSGNGLDDANLANWESIDSLLTTTVASITAGGGAAAAAAAVVNGNAQIAGTASVGAASGGAATAGGINMQPKLTNGAQSESVFIRLSNRIKALERNMSLSGQYLEELSRRYKKQVEELQQTLTQQTLTVRTLEEQSRRYIEQEQLYQQQSAELAGDVRALTYQVQACILVIIIVGTCIFLMLVMGTVYYRKLRHQNQQLQPPIASPTSSNLTKQKLSRRKSYEQMMQQSPGKQRRPSEEAMLILNSCGDVTEIANGGRQRKISVCYGSNNNIAGNMFNTKTSLHRRKGAKQSWHTSLDSAQVACAEHLDKFFDVDTLKNNKLAPKAGKKKSQQLHQLELKRQESAPGNYTQNSLPEEEPTQSDFDESLILDDDDLCNFIPNSDLAYNEFMPEGPSGYQIVDTVDGKSDKSTKKFRRVSSPAFFKSPFSKSKNKGGHFNGLGGVKGSQSAHEATSWEWYRLRRSEKNSKQLSVPSVSVTPNASLDSSSISEINFPLNSTQNSFRILGEAIMSAGVNKDTGKGSNVAAGSSSSSGASTTSSTTKKKQRAFNNIFRKVF